MRRFKKRSRRCKRIWHSDGVESGRSKAGMMCNGMRPIMGFSAQRGEVQECPDCLWSPMIGFDNNHYQIFISVVGSRNLNQNNSIFHMKMKLCDF